MIRSALALCFLSLVSADSVVPKTVLQWSRAADTCDRNGDNPIPVGTSKVVFSYSATNPGSSSNPTIPIHDFHGQIDINFQDSQAIPNAKMEADASPLVIQIDPVKIPSGTFYYCQGFDLPVPSQKVHMIRSEPIIDLAFQPYVHHIEIWQCPLALGPIDLAYRGDCNTSPINIQLCTANGVISGWAVGANPVVFPPEAGLPMGGPEQAHRFVVLQIHYNNINNVPNLVDAVTGYRFWLTSQLRPNDAGEIFFQYNTGSIVIPPGQKDYLVQGIYPGMKPGCANLIPSSGVNIFASALHTHTTGFSVNTQLIRNGVELPPIARNDNYDFNFQQWTFYDQPKVLLPGDSMILNCHYNTLTKTSPVYGGESTLNEMCMVFLFYYPAQPGLQTITHVPGQNGALPTSSCGGSFNFTSYVPLASSSSTCTPPALGNQMVTQVPTTTVLSSSITLDYLKSTYSHRLVLDAAGIYTLWWNAPSTLVGPSAIYQFAVEVQNPGWVGFGISISGDMTTSDVILGWVDPVTNSTFLQDRYATQHALPNLDASQDDFNIIGAANVMLPPSVAPPSPIYGTIPVMSPKTSFQPLFTTKAPIVSTVFPVTVMAFSDTGCNNLALGANVLLGNGTCSKVVAGGTTYYVIPMCSASSSNSPWTLPVFSDPQCTAQLTIFNSPSTSYTKCSVSGSSSVLLDCGGAAPVYSDLMAYTGTGGPTCATASVPAVTPFLTGSCIPIANAYSISGICNGFSQNSPLTLSVWSNTLCTGAPANTNSYPTGGACITVPILNFGLKVDCSSGGSKSLGFVSPTTAIPTVPISTSTTAPAVTPSAVSGTGTGTTSSVPTTSNAPTSKSSGPTVSNSASKIISTGYLFSILLLPLAFITYF